MSDGSAPAIDPRTAAEVARQLQELLKVYAPAWNEADPTTGAPTGVSAALIAIAARFSEVLIQRLNQVPQKNFLAFLELLGAALLPPQPARVPVTFLLAKGSLLDAVVPAGTQVAAPPGPGKKSPVIYETENELVATAAQLARAAARDPDEDTYADYTDEIVTTGSTGTAVFHGNRRIAHTFYVGHSQLLSSPGISDLILNVDLQSSAGDSMDLRWEIWDGAQWQDITPSDPSKDGTKGLRQSGAVDFGQVPAAQTTSVAGISKEWIRCRLLTPITRSADPRSEMIRAGMLPSIRGIGMRVHLHSDGLLIDEAYSSATGLVDLSKDFYPFGEKPKFNDTFWLAMEEAFSNAGATVTLEVRVTSPPGSKQTPSPAVASEDLRLRWEVWSGSSWYQLGISGPTGPTANSANNDPFADSTNAFLKDGKIVFTLPPNVARFNVNGKQSFWIRVRITSGNYGLDAHFVAVGESFRFVLPTLQPPSIRSLTTTYDLDKPASSQKPLMPEAVLTENDFSLADFSPSAGSLPTFAPFQPSQDLRPTLYLGFILPSGRTTFPNNTITTFFRCADLRYGQKTIPLAPDVSRRAGDPGTSTYHTFVVTNAGSAPISYAPKVLGSQWTPVISLANSDGSPSGTSPATIDVPAGQSVEIAVQVTVPPGTAFCASDAGILQLIAPDGVIYTAEFVTFAHEAVDQIQQLRLAWEYWNGKTWAALVVRDETSNLTTTGTVEFLAPPDFASHVEHGTGAWWLRVRWDSGSYDTDPRIDRIFLNTVVAAQTVTVRNENLGSSDGSPGQQFSTTRAPVIAGQRLQVREPEMPSGDELKTILEDEGPGAVLVIPDSTGTPSEIWVTWHEVPDFYASNSRSRHYALDHITGQISFGDGLNGMVPTVGSANIRLALYRTGGGAGGNKPAGSIIQLKTTVPYIDKVTNFVDATGGADAETMDSLVSRAPKEIRHRRRAVTQDDYEDLVHVAAADVARVLCVPNRDLVADPFDKMPPMLGNVSLIIVPNSTDPKPQPSFELVRRVQSFIAASCPVTATVVVIGPSYLQINVRAEIGLASLEGAGTIAGRVHDALAAFLHPLTGGFDGRGWEFGREPHRSDIYRVIEEIPGVDHIRALSVESSEDFPESRETGRFLVYSGGHTINLVFEP